VKIFQSNSPIGLAIIAVLAIAVIVFLWTSAGLSLPTSPLGIAVTVIVVMLVLGWLARAVVGSKR
jgi:uncharacterized membrane protein YhhN